MLTWLACALGTAQQHSAGFSAYERANDLFREQKFQGAMDALDEALRLDPNLVPALTLRARLAMAANRYDVARQALERAIRADPQSWYAQFLYGFQFYQQNEMPAAITAFQKALSLNPRDPQSALYLGLSDEALGQVPEASELYSRAIRLEQSQGAVHAETLLTAARLLLLESRFSDAAHRIDQAMKADPQSRDPHFESARLCLKTGQIAKAIQEGETALQLKRGDVSDRQVQFVLVQAYRAAGRDKDAESHAAALRTLEKADEFKQTSKDHER